MSGTGFVRIAKLSGAGIVLAAARHNRRAIQAEVGGGGSIEPARSHLNYRLAGPDSPEDVAEMANLRMKAAGLKLRKDAVRAIELVFSLPRDSGIDHRVYFSDCLRWASDQFAGAENVLSADVHLDESAPHCHVLILPLVAGRMVGSDLVGGGKAFAAHSVAFHERVASRYGLRKAPARLGTAARCTLAAAVLRRMRETADPALRSPVWAVLRDAIEREPEPWAGAMGLNLEVKPAKPLRSMTSIFTSPGKGPKKELAASTPIGFAEHVDRRSLCSVGFVPATASASAQSLDRTERKSEPVDMLVSTESTFAPDGHHGTDTPHRRRDGADHARFATSVEPPDLDRELVFPGRLRESERASTSWCEERRDFVDPAPERGRPSRAAAESWVSAQLARVRAPT